MSTATCRSCTSCVWTVTATSSSCRSSSGAASPATPAGRAASTRSTAMGNGRTATLSCATRKTSMNTSTTDTLQRLAQVLEQRKQAPADSSYVASLHAKDRKSTRLNSSHVRISYAVFCLKKKKLKNTLTTCPKFILYYI